MDPDAPADAQVKAIYPKLLEFIKLKRSEIEGKLAVPHSVLGQSQNVIRKYCQIQSENYSGQGVVMQIGVVPGDFDQFMKELNGVTKGDYTFDVDGMHGQPGAEAEESGKGGKGGKGKGGGGKGKGKKK